MPTAVDITLDLSQDISDKIDAAVQLVREQLPAYGPGKVRLQIGRPVRTTQANAYYRAAVLERIYKAAREAGYEFTRDQLHDGYYKPKYGDVEYIEVNGEVRAIPHTRFMAQDAFWYFVQNVIMDDFTAQFGLEWDDVDWDKEFKSYNL